MLVKKYDENFNEVEVEVEDFLMEVIEKVIDGGVGDLERSPIVPNTDGTVLSVAVTKPGRNYGEDGDTYRIYVEKIL